MREYGVWSIEYRERQKSKGARGYGDMGTRGDNEDQRTRGPEELAPGIRRLKAERLTPEWPTAVAVTRHLSIGY